MRPLTLDEANALRACASPLDTAIVAADCGILSTLIESGRVVVSWEDHPDLGYELARFDVTELGRLALRFAVPLSKISP